MKHPSKWLALLIVLLLSTSLACGLTGGEEAPPPAPETDSAETTTTDTEPADTSSETTTDTDTPAEPATSTDTDTETTEPAADGSGSESTDAGTDSDSAEGAGEVLDLSAIDTSLDFDTYRYAISMDFEGQDESGMTIDQTITGEFAGITDPQSASMTINMESLAAVEGLEGMGEFSMITVEDGTYMIMPGLGCMNAAMFGDELDNPMENMAEPDTLLGNVKGATRVMPNETINGIETEHYVFDETALEDTEGEVEQLDGHIYVAADGGYMVRMTMTGTGDFGSIDETTDGIGTYNITWDLLEINGDVTIEVPEDCSEGIDLGSFE